MLALANNFLAGSLLTLLIPAFVFVMIIALLTYMVVHVSAGRREGAPPAPSAPAPASAGVPGSGDRTGEAGRGT